MSMASSFGGIQFVTSSEYRPIESSIKNRDIKKKVVEVMEKFDPEKDYVLMVGSPIVTGKQIGYPQKN